MPRKVVKCHVSGCEKLSIGKSGKCKGHGGGRRCSEEGCTKSAQGSTDKCVEHGGGRRCSEEGCNKCAVGRTDKCVEHGGGRRCSEEGCNKSAQGSTDKCIGHGGGRRCSEEGCNKCAVGRTDKCIEHGGGRRCSEEGCNKSAQGSTDKCKGHGGGRRCPNCIDWIDSRCGKPKYDNYCSTCFKQIFQDDPRSKVVYAHRKEMRVRNFINDRYEGFVHDKPLYTGNCDCTHRRRIDHRKLIGNTLLAIETDEFAHRGYDSHDEMIRYDDLYMVHSGKWVYIRFNPDGGNVDMDDKLAKLEETIDECIERIENEDNRDLVEIITLYY